MENKSQTSLEALLILAAITIAGIVIGMYVLSIGDKEGALGSEINKRAQHVEQKIRET